jgi:AcrR family transcriptional regulator
VTRKVAKRPYASGAARREQIAEAGLALIAREGIDGLTLRKVAAAIGTTPSAAYRHFAGKEEIVDAVLDLVGEALQAGLDAICAGPGDPLEKLEAVLMAHVAFLVERLGAGRHFVTLEILSRHPEKKARILRNTLPLRNAVAALLAEAQREGRLGGAHDRDVLVRLFMGIFLTEILECRSSCTAADMQDRVRATWNVFRTLITKGP